MNGPPGHENAVASGEAHGADTAAANEQDDTANVTPARQLPESGISPVVGADGSPAAKRFELRIRKESTGAVVLFQSYSTFEECQRVAERLVEVGCPVPVIVEVLS